MPQFFGNEFKNEFPNRRLRTDFSDGDLDKERRFYVLTKTKMPAILTESFFMDNLDEFKKHLKHKKRKTKDYQLSFKSNNQN